METYKLAQPWKRLLARIIDIILVSLIPILVTTIWYVKNKNLVQTWWALLILIALNYILLFTYFLLIPLFWSGRTIAKKLFGIRIVNIKNIRVKFTSLLIRESFLVFIPITISFTNILVTQLIQIKSQEETINISENSINFIFNRVTISFILAWYLGIIIVMKIDKKHQLFYDRKHELCVINIKPVINAKKYNSINKDLDRHIHLKTHMPGSISSEELKNIDNLK